MKISIQEAASFLECSDETVTSMLRDGDLPGIKPGKAWVIPLQGFYAAVESLGAQAAYERTEAKRQALEKARGL